MAAPKSSSCLRSATLCTKQHVFPLGLYHHPSRLHRSPQPQQHFNASRTSISCSSSHQARSFSTTQTPQKGKPGRDLNRNRGVSPIRRTGLRYPLSVSKYPLPKPVLDPEQRDKVLGTEDHGLWKFFNADKTRVQSPESEITVGRPWTVYDLRPKSWEDLHALWWVCCIERNRIATAKQETLRLDIEFGEGELLYRDKKIQETQTAIKKTLKERWWAWENARKLALDDPSVDLSGEGPAFQPFMEDQEETNKRDPNAPIEI